MARFTPTKVTLLSTALPYINQNFDKLSALMERVLMRDGTSTNTVTHNIDVNHFRLVNVADATVNADAINLGQVKDLISGLHGADGAQGPKGDPGSPGGGYATRAAIAALNPTNLDDAYLTESGRQGKFVFNNSNLSSLVSLDPQQGVYIAPAAHPTGSSGAWVRQIDSVPNVMWFGAKRNGLMSNNATGNDDTAAIQAALDFAMYSGWGKAIAPAGGVYRIDGTVRLGSPTSGQTVSLFGGGMGKVAGYGVGGASFLHTAKDRPCFNLTRGRGCGISNIQIVGQNTITDTLWQNLTFRSNPANYVTNSCQDNINSPYCAVAVDGDGLNAPAVPYVGMTYTGINSGTSDYFVEDCSISNFVVGIAVQPNHDSNGDFASFRRTRVSFCKVGISVGNVNARCNNFRDTNFYWCYTCIDGTNYHGPNRGNLGGAWDNIHWNFCFQLFDVALNYSVALTISNCYCEGSIRIGKAISAAARAPLNFVGCSFVLEHAEIIGGNESYVDRLLDYSGSCKFDSCIISVSSKFMTFDGDPKFKNCTFTSFPYANYGSLTSDELAVFNQTGGILLPGKLISEQNTTRTFENCYVTSWGTLDSDDLYNKSHIYSERMAYQGVVTYSQLLGKRAVQAGVGGVTALTVTGRTVTFTQAGHGMEVNGIVWTNDARAIFRVTAVAGNDVTMEAVSGFKQTAGTYSLITFTNFISAYEYVPPGLAFNVSVEAYLQVTSGSNIVQIKDTDGTTNLTTAASLSSATKLFWTAHIGPLAPFPVKATVSSVDPATGQITMSANARRTGLYRLAANIAPLS